MMSKNELKTYSPESGLAKPSKMIVEIYNGFKEGRHLAYRLFIRDLRASVRQSYLGMFWLFIPALATAGIWVFLNDQKVVQIENVPMAYPAFALCGTVLWSLFTEAVTKPIQRFNAAKGMMAKLNFPREALILAAFYDLCFSLFLKLLVLLPALMLFGFYPSMDWFIAFGGILLLFILGFSFSLILLPLAMLYTDINRGLGLAFQFLMYLSPVIYPLKDSGMLGSIQKINPVSPFIELVRSHFGNYEFSMMPILLVWIGVTLIVFILGMLLVKVALSAILERVGA